MTVSYSDNLLFLLLRWRGSVWKFVWKDMLSWLVIYYAIRLVITNALTTEHEKEQAEKVIFAFRTFCDKIPLSFLLGFYVVQIVTRWWNQILSIPYPDDIMVMTNSCFAKPEQKHIRQTIARWLILCQTLVFRRISTRIRTRFPKLDSLIEAGLLTSAERDLMRSTRCVNNWWQLPLQWTVNKIVAPSDLPPPMKNNFVTLLNAFRSSLRQLYVHDWICIPLVYTQTCTVVVYGYFAFCAIGHQYARSEIDLFVPWLTILQVIFYVGWLNVGHDLMRPFGEDDDDVELNWMLDRNAAVAINLADQVCEENPELIEDQSKQQEFVRKMMTNLSYSKASLLHKNRLPKMKAAVKLKEDEQEMVSVDAMHVYLGKHTNSAPPDINASFTNAGTEEQTAFVRQAKTQTRHVKPVNLF